MGWSLTLTEDERTIGRLLAAGSSIEDVADQIGDTNGAVWSAVFNVLTKLLGLGRLQVEQALKQICSDPRFKEWRDVYGPSWLSARDAHTIDVILNRRSRQTRALSERELQSVFFALHGIGRREARGMVSRCFLLMGLREQESRTRRLRIGDARATVGALENRRKTEIETALKKYGLPSWLSLDDDVVWPEVDNYLKYILHELPPESCSVLTRLLRSGQLLDFNASPQLVQTALNKLMSDDQPASEVLAISLAMQCLMAEHGRLTVVNAGYGHRTQQPRVNDAMERQREYTDILRFAVRRLESGRFVNALMALREGGEELLTTWSKDDKLLFRRDLVLGALPDHSMPSDLAQIEGRIMALDLSLQLLEVGKVSRTASKSATPWLTIELTSRTIRLSKVQEEIAERLVAGESLDQIRQKLSQEPIPVKGHLRTMYFKAAGLSKEVALKRLWSLSKRPEAQEVMKAHKGTHHTRVKDVVVFNILANAGTLAEAAEHRFVNERSLQDLYLTLVNLNGGKGIYLPTIVADLREWFQEVGVQGIEREA